MLTIRHAAESEGDAIWAILEPILRAGETYTLPTDWTREEALAYWLAADHEAFVAEDDGQIVGTYYLHANQRGNGAHVANCGYATAARSSGRGVATAMCTHSLHRAAERGFKAMQFNFVVSSNERAIALWRRLGFSIVGTVPQAFDHPRLGLVDAYIMHRHLP